MSEHKQSNSYKYLAVILIVALCSTIAFSAYAITSISETGDQKIAEAKQQNNQNTYELANLLAVIANGERIDLDYNTWHLKEMKQTTFQVYEPEIGINSATINFNAQLYTNGTHYAVYLIYADGHGTTTPAVLLPEGVNSL